VVAVHGGDETPLARGLQVVLAHEPRDFLGVDDDTALAQLGANPAIAVGLEFIADCLHGRDDLGVMVECAPDGGQIAGWELTGAAGLSEDESHGQAPHPQPLNSSVRSPRSSLQARPCMGWRSATISPAT
jgi:hypothetical protein